MAAPLTTTEPAPAAGAVVEAEGRTVLLVPEIAALDAVVDAGPSQCQWSPWGWQPTEAVGLGGREPVPAASAWDLELVVAAPTPAAELVAGPSQCQWSPCGSQPIDSVGLGARDLVPVAEWEWSSSSWSWVLAVVTAAPVAVAGPSQCQWSP